MKTFRQLITTLVIATGLFTPVSVRAEETYVCGQSYGQPVVCGVKTPEEEPLIVEAGLKEDLRLVGAALIASSFLLYLKSKRTKAPIFDQIYLG